MNNVSSGTFFKSVSTNAILNKLKIALPHISVATFCCLPYVQNKLNFSKNFRFFFDFKKYVYVDWKFRTKAVLRFIRQQLGGQFALTVVGVKTQ